MDRDALYPVEPDWDIPALLLHKLVLIGSQSRKRPLTQSAQIQPNLQHRTSVMGGTTMKRLLLIVAIVILGTSGLVLASEAEESWTGEIVDLACYVPKGAKGPDHAGCAKSCVKNGQPMGLLTDDGTLVLLAADHKNGEAYEALKDMAGAKAHVSGLLAEKDGMKVVTVTGSKAAG